ncbi:MAG: tyrosine--tRNA ligase [Actinomycetota bacterium]
MGAGVFAELEWRGLVHQVTDPALAGLLVSGHVTAYCGFDPTAQSLTTAHLLQILGLRRLQMAGHRPIALAGGGTGLVGDPSGRDSERLLLETEQVEANVSNIKGQLERLLDFEPGSAQAALLNNDEWLSPMLLTHFLRDVGKHFSVNAMLGKDSVRQRLEDREQGLSFAEFSYMLLQSYDFLHLFENYSCELQVGGSDQWGNITAGIDLIRRVKSQQAYGLTSPLLIGASGRKMSKSEGGAVWLDARLTSPYRFYQFWFNTEDALVVQFLKYFTFADRDRIEELAAEVVTRPHDRQAQTTLAAAMTTLVHGEGETEKAIRASKALFSQEIAGLDEATLLDVLGEAPSSTFSRAQVEEGLPLVDLLVETGLSSSKSESRQHLSGGGVYVNNLRVSEADRRLNTADLLLGKYVALRRGKKSHHLIYFQ